MRKRKIRLFAISILGIITASQSADATVLTGPITNPANGHKYYKLSAGSWTDAETEALGLGGHLVTINDEAENNWVISTFAGDSYALWIGLNDAAEEGTYVWASGDFCIWSHIRLVTMGDQ